MPDNVCLVSGGMDSAVLLWHLKPNVKALMFNYGQRHQLELLHATALCREAKVEYDVANLSEIKHLISKGSQTGGIEPPDGHYTELSMKTTIVPNRNAIMLSIAVGHAISIGAQEVWYAAHGGDHAIYPDCRPEFVFRFNQAMQEGNAWEHIHVNAPFVEKSKADLVTLGTKLGVPFQLTYSCYKGKRDHCGTCGTCTERKEAFQLAGVEDPTVYELAHQ
jgi:7-cyano-7-deazaguanine synthase